ncbi:hypothetical protein SDRG_15130 [Saprolegnia diclina VS20]|uniref:Uncharacterized protein n=1 Tax=Saprolegnia diclina (strain VS20) TaxID=1156394 RepID=T0PXR1_SAPDV|nr:hypothetical protein SDRG_15130 [Saprolegnia diclina VS20]EQC27016.1 hypothetical protein SDRG_15130 [Saprolegnia diclina VS20]|eukprot:XP_008619516.1 hypothetical protein SDRG_15130 [Saprolegnia diclina VS20]
MEEAGFTKFISGDIVYARARRLHRATTGRTTKRFVSNWALEDYLATMRRTPPPVVAPFIKDTARDLLARLENHKVYLPDDRDLDDLKTLGLPRVLSLEALPQHQIEQILARDGLRSPSAHKVAVRLSKKLRQLQCEREAMRIVGLPGMLLHRVTTRVRCTLQELAANRDSTDYAAEAAAAAKQFCRRIHKSETHGDCSFGNSCRLDRRRTHDWGCGKRPLKTNWCSDYEDDIAANADALDDMWDANNNYNDEEECNLETNGSDDEYDLCADVVATPTPMPQAMCAIS